MQIQDPVDPAAYMLVQDEPKEKIEAEDSLEEKITEEEITRAKDRLGDAHRSIISQLIGATEALISIVGFKHPQNVWQHLTRMSMIYAPEVTAELQVLYEETGDEDIKEMADTYLEASKTCPALIYILSELEEKGLIDRFLPTAKQLEITKFDNPGMSDPAAKLFTMFRSGLPVIRETFPTLDAASLTPDNVMKYYSTHSTMRQPFMDLLTKVGVDNYNKILTDYKNGADPRAINQNEIYQSALDTMPSIGIPR